MVFIKHLLALTLILLITACQPPQDWQTSDITGAMPELEFTLTETSQNTRVTAEEYKGKISMLFFGFTHCPEVCPTTLLQLQQATIRLGELADQTQILFVSVDPERDNVAGIQRYVENFGSNVIGLRGEEGQLKALTQRYFVTYEKETVPADGNYDMMHSSQVYVFDNRGHVRLLFRASDPVDAMVADLQGLIRESS